MPNAPRRTQRELDELNRFAAFTMMKQTCSEVMVRTLSPWVSSGSLDLGRIMQAQPKRYVRTSRNETSRLRPSSHNTSLTQRKL
jgi:hypothetical protein